MLKTVGNPSTRSGDQTIIDGNLVIGTAGKGIDFSADPSAPGMTSELLDDYEEGTWTPELQFGGASTGITYAQRSGRYTKIGRTVTINFYIELSSKGTAIGNASVQGLPFVDNNVISACPIMFLSGFAGAYNSGVCYSYGTALDSFRAYTVGPMTEGNFTDSAFFFGTFTYSN